MRRVRTLVYWPLANNGNIAIHEAGHLVTARYLGMATGMATVTSHAGTAHIGMGSYLPPVGDGPDLGHVDGDQPALVADMLTASYPQRWPGKTFEEAGIAYATMLMAGRQAELIQAGIVLTNGQRLVMRDPDHLQAEAIVKCIGYNHLSLGFCQARARELLAAHWDDVQQLADEI